MADVWSVLVSTDAVVALVKLYVTAAADDALDHVKLIDVAFAETALQLSVSVGAETSNIVLDQVNLQTLASLNLMLMTTVMTPVRP